MVVLSVAICTKNGKGELPPPAALSALALLDDVSTSVDMLVRLNPAALLTDTCSPAVAAVCGHQQDTHRGALVAAIVVSYHLLLV